MQIIEKLSNMLIPECMDRLDFENDLTVYYQVGKIFPHHVSFIKNLKGISDKVPLVFEVGGHRKPIWEKARSLR